MNPEQLDRARATLNTLVERFPKAFTNPPRPLKVGITKDLIAAAVDDSTGAQAVRDSTGAQAVRDAIAMWCRRPSYLKAQTEGAVQIDLDGNACDNVTAEQSRSGEAAARVEGCTTVGAAAEERESAEGGA